MVLHVCATCYQENWDPLLGVLVSSIREFENVSEGRLKTILLVFKRKPQARRAVNLGSCPEEEEKKNP